MGLSRGEAYEMLELPIGADPDSIRTSYKRLALKYHPTKNASSLEASTRFNEISLAYKRLVTDSENVQISPDQSMELFQQMFAPKHTTYTNGYAVDSSDDNEEEEDTDDEEEEDYTAYLNRLQMRLDGSSGRTLTAEEIEKNANELITEEEKEKRRAEKRRAKKKRRREKKRIEKQKSEQKKDEDQKKKPSKVRENGDTSGKPVPKSKKGSSGSEAEDFDPTAAFFTQVVNKKKKPGAVSEPPAPSQKQKQPETRLPGKEEENAEDIDPVVLRSRHLAIRGNEMANLGHYQVAIDLFTEAVKLDPRDFRFFGNRSYCYDRMQQYERALKDADKAISLAKDWPKGYFRKGRALAGMKLYADAEQSFMQVLKLDRNCEDAMQELLRVRTHQLTEMGFTKAQAEQAIRQHGTVQTALETLLAGAVAENSLANEVYISDEEDYSTPSPQSAAAAAATSPGHSSHLRISPTMHHTQPHSSKTVDVKMDPSNPEGLTALWVGNVLPEVTDKKLRKMFSEYGQVTSVRLLPEKYCAFINFKTKESAGRAMNGLQSMECAGQRLLIKFPDNPISNGGSSSSGGTGSVVLRKGQANPAPQSKSSSGTSNAASKRQQQQQQQLQSLAQDKLTGPVNGDECYFWRTTGCQFGKNCHYKHVPDHKGVDKKPWQKSGK